MPTKLTVAHIFTGKLLLFLSAFRRLCRVRARGRASD